MFDFFKKKSTAKITSKAKPKKSKDDDDETSAKKNYVHSEIVKGIYVHNTNLGAAIKNTARFLGNVQSKLRRYTKRSSVLKNTEKAGSTLIISTESGRLFEVPYVNQFGRYVNDGFVIEKWRKGDEIHVMPDDRLATLLTKQFTIEYVKLKNVTTKKDELKVPVFATRLLKVKKAFSSDFVSETKMKAREDEEMRLKSEQLRLEAERLKMKEYGKYHKRDMKKQAAELEEYELPLERSRLKSTQRQQLSSTQRQQLSKQRQRSLGRNIEGNQGKTDQEWAIYCDDSDGPLDEKTKLECRAYYKKMNPSPLRLNGTSKSKPRVLSVKKSLGKVNSYNGYTEAEWANYCDDSDHELNEKVKKQCKLYYKKMNPSSLVEKNKKVKIATSAL